MTLLPITTCILIICKDRLYNYSIKKKKNLKTGYTNTRETRMWQTTCCWEARYILETNRDGCQDDGSKI